MVVFEVAADIMLFSAFVPRGFLPFLPTLLQQWAQYGGEFSLIVSPSSFLQSATRAGIGKQPIANAVEDFLSLK